MMQLIQPPSITTHPNYAIDSAGCQLMSPSVHSPLVHSPSVRFPPPVIAVDSLPDESDRDILISPLHVHASDHGHDGNHNKDKPDKPSVHSTMRLDAVRSISATVSGSTSIPPPPCLCMTSDAMNMLLSAGDTTSCSVEAMVRSSTMQSEEEIEA